jgi:hydrogenase maturation protease
MRAKNLVLGIGSPVVCDDAIAFHVIEKLRSMNLADTDMEEASTSGLDLIEMMLDYEVAIIVDAIITGAVPPGTVMVLAEDSFSTTVHGVNPHEANIATSIELGHTLMPDRMPKAIHFVVVEVNDVWTVTDKMTPEVQDAVEPATETVLGLLAGKEYPIHVINLQKPQSESDGL